MVDDVHGLKGFLNPICTEITVISIIPRGNSDGGRHSSPAPPVLSIETPLDYREPP
jgi:hypothetical protein